MKRNLSNKAKDVLSKFKDEASVPNHIAIIMDGNGRWAKKRGLPRAAGHKSGVETVREVLESCVALGVKYLTLYTFSTENWKRPKDEVSTLMRLIVQSLHNELDEMHKNGVKLNTIGELEKLPVEVQKEIKDALKKTENNTTITLNLALSYSGRTEITDTVRKIAELYAEGKIEKHEINEELISSSLYTKDIPDPDLMIRSGGEYRISNFLLWQLAYSELYVTDVLWPEFTYKDLIKAVKDFQKRERRFGLTSEQISNNGNKSHAQKLSKETV